MQLFFHSLFTYTPDPNNQYTYFCVEFREKFAVNDHSVDRDVIIETNLQILRRVEVRVDK